MVQCYHTYVLGPSTCLVFSEVSIAWAGGLGLRHIPIFGPTKDSVLQLGCESEMCGSGVMEVRFYVPVDVFSWSS